MIDSKNVGGYLVICTIPDTTTERLYHLGARAWEFIKSLVLEGLE